MIVDRLYRYCVFAADLDDGSGTHDWKKSSLSATKLAGYAAVFVGLGIAIATKQVTPAINFLVTAGISALFGRSIWKTWLMRNTFATSISEARETKISHATSTSLSKVVLEARDVALGFDPSRPTPDPAFAEVST